MSAFADELLLQFLDDIFLEDLLKNQLGLASLFNVTYQAEDIDLREINLAEPPRRQFQMPAFETIRTNGTDERIMPSAERVKVDRAQPRYGRLAWVDIFLDVFLATKVASQKMPIESISSENLLDKLGGVTSITDLKNKLSALYPQSIVDAFFKQLRISSVEDFTSRPSLFLEFVFKAAPPFDPNDPQNARNFSLNVCVQFQPELKISEALQSAKLCRSILENERDFAQTFNGGDIETPYAFVVIFADSVIQDNAVGNLTRAQIKSGIKSLFQAEGILAHFL
jgi:hypothetical protein